MCERNVKKNHTLILFDIFLRKYILFCELKYIKKKSQDYCSFPILRKIYLFDGKFCFELVQEEKEKGIWGIMGL